MSDKELQELASTLTFMSQKLAQCSDRYLEAEELLIELADLNPFKLALSKHKILDFLKSRLDKYDF